MSKSSAVSINDEVIELGELTSSIGFLLRIAQVKLFDVFFQTLAQYGLKPGEFTVLWVIGLNPGLRQGTVARHLAIKPAHMTKLVQRLVEAGFVNRDIPEHDRRSVRLSLTDEGEKFVEKNKGEFLNFHKVERGLLSEAECEQLQHLLRKFSAIPS